MEDTKVELELARGPNISIINLVNCLIEKAEKSGASDIHIDPQISDVGIRFRIDGVLQDVYTVPKNIHSEIISRIKVLAGLRSDEHQATQDGRFRYDYAEENKHTDVRISIAPTYHGENAVMRLLADKAENLSLDYLGYSDEDRKKIENAMKQPSGMILVTGPTGSGKTTTLYTFIKMLNTREASIVTIEDPIEFAIDGVKQIQVNSRTGLTFATGLRSILRQDPDIIMVGEIRDQETANIAVNTALTGHLLLSTLHTNDAATTLPRLLDMKVESFLVASTVNIAIGQRLVRRICGNCKEKIKVTEGFKKSLQALSSSTRVPLDGPFYRGLGCTACFGSGYAGRLCINEVLVADGDIREAILNRIPSSELKRIAIKNGMTTMFEDGLKKVASGDTTIEEVLRVIHE